MRRRRIVKHRQPTRAARLLARHLTPAEQRTWTRYGFIYLPRQKIAIVRHYAFGELLISVYFADKKTGLTYKCLQIEDVWELRDLPYADRVLGLKLYAQVRNLRSFRSGYRRYVGWGENADQWQTRGISPRRWAAIRKAVCAPVPRRKAA